MTIDLAAGPLVALVAGILILIVPRLLNYIVAIYLVVIGLIGIFGVGTLHATQYSAGPRAGPSTQDCTAGRAGIGSDGRPMYAEAIASRHGSALPGA